MKFLLNFTLFPFSHKVLKTNFELSEIGKYIESKKSIFFDASKKETEEKLFQKGFMFLRAQN